MQIDLSRIVTAKTKQAQAARETLLADLAAAGTDLAAGDWRVIRAAENGSVLPEADRTARQALRDRISELRETLATDEAEAEAGPIAP